MSSLSLPPLSVSSTWERTAHQVHILSSCLQPSITKLLIESQGPRSFRFSSLFFLPFSLIFSLVSNFGLFYENTPTHLFYVLFSTIVPILHHRAQKPA